MTDIEQVATTVPNLAKTIRPRLGVAEVTTPDEKPARTKVPKPFVGYLVENADYTPPARTKNSWLFHLPPLFFGIADARAERAAFQAMAPDDPPKPIFKVTITFEVVEDDRTA
jgi:hypothetical protein